MTTDIALVRRVKVMRAALEEIEAALPSCSAEAETVWENRQRAGHYRELQGIARAALKAAKGVA